MKSPAYIFWLCKQNQLDSIPSISFNKSSFKLPHTTICYQAQQYFYIQVNEDVLPTEFRSLAWLLYQQWGKTEDDVKRTW